MDSIKFLAGTLSEIIQKLIPKVKAGMKTKDIEKEAVKLFERYGVSSGTIGYKGFPGHLCISVNEEVAHGVPGDRVIKEGDLVTLDMVITDGTYFADMARTIGVGKVSEKAEKLIKVSRELTDYIMEYLKPGLTMHDIGVITYFFAINKGVWTVPNLYGHGIGDSLHKNPPIPAAPNLDRVNALRAGDIVCIEPHVIEDASMAVLSKDGFTYVSEEGNLLSAVTEDMVLITKDGAVNLTKWENKNND